MKILLTISVGFLFFGTSLIANAAQCPCSFDKTDFAVNKLKGKAAHVELLQCVQDERHLQVDIVEGSFVDMATLTADMGQFGVQCRTTIVTKRKGVRAEEYQLTTLEALRCMKDLKTLATKFAQRFGTQVTGNCGL